MIKIEKTEVVGLEATIRGMRNPKNSWDRSDSTFEKGVVGNTYGISGKLQQDAPNSIGYENVSLGPNDLELMGKLANGGPVHAKYRRMICVYLDITAPLYWWKEFDTYKVGTVANSCSTMHKIADKEFVIDDFSYEHLNAEGLDLLRHTIDFLNKERLIFLDSKDKNDWWQLIQALPSSYNQKRTILLNYEVLVGIYKWRYNHKQDEWRIFCKWIEELPYSHLITMGNGPVKFE